LHSSKAGILGRLASKSLAIPVIFTAHGWAFTEGVPDRRRKFYRFLERLMAKFGNMIITVSDYDRNLAIKYGVGNSRMIKTIHNGMPDIPHGRQDRNRSRTSIKLIMVARFDSQKNHSLLLEALSC